MSLHDAGSSAKIKKTHYSMFPLMRWSGGEGSQLNRLALAHVHRALWKLEDSAQNNVTSVLHP